MWSLLRWSRLGRLAVGLGLLGLMACRAAAAEPAPVHSLSEILVSDPAFSELRPDSVTVTIETTIPVVCAAVYGLTTAYGALATDTDMAGGGHTRHHPVLAGLMPDTAYQLRLQGVGPDGTLYVSDNTIFHTPPAVAQAENPLGRNVALQSVGARVVAVSSNYGGGAMDSPFGGDNAIDGNPATEWSSAGDGDAAWIEIDLGRPVALSGLGLQTRTMGTTAQIGRFRVVTDSGESLGPFNIPAAGSIYTFPVDANAQRLRFEVVASSGGNTGVAEIEVFAR